MRLYPVFLSLKSRDCLVVGDGPNARRRARMLMRCGALVTLMAKDKPPASFDGLHRHLDRRFREEDPADYWLVIAAMEDVASNASIAQACQKHRTFCHEVTSQANSSFVLPAIIDRSPLLIAISSGSAATALVLSLKRKLDGLIPAAYAQMGELMDQHQGKLEKMIPKQSERALFWRPLLDGPIAQHASSNTAAHFEQSLEKAMAEYDHKVDAKKRTGFVSLVGAGPGDPDLLTLRALQLIQSADVIVYDRLVSESIVDLRRKDTQMLYAGKAKSEHSMPQVAINQLLVDLAIKGHNVVRLKGGDPFIFGRGGEEIEMLAKNNIPFQVVPGVTAATGCSAYAGIPLTHRDHAQSCVFVTGHLKNDKINLNWKDFHDPTQTIVFYMGLTGLTRICATLIEIGRLADTPAALVEQGTTANQRTHVGTLESLPALVEHRAVKAPTLLIVGSVVSLHKTLNWFQPDQSQADTTQSHFSSEKSHP
ncbi:MAG: siroheme synthase CysG [Granulosicoccaceae bacterium]